jgi:hypothetical protein
VQPDTDGQQCGVFTVKFRGFTQFTRLVSGFTDCSCATGGLEFWRVVVAEFINFTVNGAEDNGLRCETEVVNFEFKLKQRHKVNSIVRTSGPGIAGSRN